MNRLFNTKNIGFFDIAVKGSEGWFCNMFFNGLFHLNLITLDIDFVATLPSEDICAKEQYGPIEFYDNKLIIAPTGEKNILIYDIACQTFKKIDISEFILGQENNAFRQIIIVGNVAYMIPGRSKCILKLSLKDYTIEQIYFDIDELHISDFDENRWLFSDSFYSNDIIYISSWQSNVLVEYRIKTDTFKYIPVSGLKNLSSCSYNNGTIIVTDKNMAFISLISDDYQEIYDLTNKIKYERGIRKVFPYKDKYILFPYKCNRIVECDGKFNDFVQVMELPGDYLTGVVVTYPDNARCCKIIHDKEILFYSLFDNKIVLYNMDTKEVKEKLSEIQGKEKKKISDIYEKVHFKGIVRENKITDLKTFINYIGEI